MNQYNIKCYDRAEVLLKRAHGLHNAAALALLDDDKVSARICLSAARRLDRQATGYWELSRSFEELCRSTY